MVVGDNEGVTVILIRNGPFSTEMFQVLGRAVKSARRFPTPALVCNEVSAPIPHFYRPT